MSCAAKNADKTQHKQDSHSAAPLRPAFHGDHRPHLHELVEAVTWAEPEARERVAPANPMRQVPTLVYPDGEIMTESAAVLIDLADRHPESKLSPGLTDPRRRQFLRWMVHVSSAIYSLHWIKPDVTRIGRSARIEARRRRRRARADPPEVTTSSRCDDPV
ncbi:glutathione S-transferase family protein [Sorangium sp. So ce269]